MPLPSAEYARSKLPKKEKSDANAEKKKAEDEARKAIECAYKEGMDKFTVFVYVPESVLDEMNALGWNVRISLLKNVYDFSLDKD
jgi:hypothetical protein